MLDDRQEDARRVGLLEGVRADQVRLHLARDDHHRRRVEERVGDRRDEVRRAGPGRRHGDADLAGGARIALRHVAGALLVAHEHVLDRGLRRGERVVDRKDRPAGDPEADLDAARLERADDGLRAGEALAFVGIGRGRLGGGGPLLCGGHRSLPVGQLAVGVETVSACGNLVGDLVGGRRAAQVGRARAVVEHAGDGGLDRARGRGLPELVEQQRDREDRARGIGLAVPGDVGRRAVDRLEDAGPAVGQRRRGREADAAADGGGEVGEHVAEEVLGHDHVVGAGPLDEQHRHRVDELVLERHLGVPLGDLAGHAPPQLGGREHVGLVDAREAAAAALGEGAGALDDAADLGRRVVAGVVGRVVAETAVAEVDAADQLAHDHEVELGHELLAQRARGVLRVAARGADVGVAAEHRAQREQALLGAHRGAVPLRPADGAQQHGVGAEAGLARGVRERMAAARRSRRRRTGARPARRRSRSAPRPPRVRAAPLS